MGQAPFAFSDLIDFCWLNAMAYRRWTDWSDKRAVADDVRRWDGARVPDSVVTDMLRRYDPVAHESFDSGLDVTVFRETGAGRTVIALDGTDRSMQAQSEFRRDVSDGLALMLGRSVRQVRDYLQFLRRVAKPSRDGQIVSVGHSLGGYVQQVGGALGAARLDAALALNAPGPWPFSRDWRRVAGKPTDRLFNVSALDFVYPIGRPIGRRLVLRDLRRHGVADLARYLEARSDAGWRLRLEPAMRLEPPPDGAPGPATSNRSAGAYHPR